MGNVEKAQFLIFIIFNRIIVYVICMSSNKYICRGRIFSHLYNYRAMTIGPSVERDLDQIAGDRLGDVYLHCHGANAGISDQKSIQEFHSGPSRSPVVQAVIIPAEGPRGIHHT